MGPWGFVWLAYGVVWTAIILYIVSLECRLRKGRAKLSRLKSREDAGKHAT
jgi:CcmD family protein